MTEPPSTESRGSRFSGKNKLLVGIIIVLVVLLVVSTSFAVYYASNQKPRKIVSSIQETMVMDNQSVVGATGAPAYVYASTFTAPTAGYLVVTGTSFPVNYSIAEEIVMNATKPDHYIILGNGTQEPYYNIHPDSANTTLITVPFINDFALLPVLRGNISVYVYTPSGANVVAVLNATYYY